MHLLRALIARCLDLVVVMGGEFCHNFFLQASNPFELDTCPLWYSQVFFDKLELFSAIGLHLIPFLLSSCFGGLFDKTIGHTKI